MGAHLRYRPLPLVRAHKGYGSLPCDKKNLGRRKDERAFPPSRLLYN